MRNANKYEFSPVDDWKIRFRPNRSGFGPSRANPSTTHPNKKGSVRT